MRIASIDIGSNTVLLLIADITKGREIKTINNYYKMPRIGKGVTEGKEITEEKIEKLFGVLYTYKNEIEKYKCTKIIITATAAMRKASNADKIIKRAKRMFDFDIHTISGEQEALFSFLGSTSSLEPEKERLVIDIGGGSTELIFGNSNEIKYSMSFPEGAVSLTEKFITSDPYPENELSKMAEKIKELFQPAISKIPSQALTYSVAGTPTTLACIKHRVKEYSDDFVESTILTTADLNYILNEIQSKSASQILEDYGEVVKGREDVIVTGTLLLKTILEVLNINETFVSTKGIRYGSVVNYLSELRD